MNIFRYNLLALGIVLSSTLFAQDADRKHSIGLYQNTTDYNVSLLNNKVFAFDSALSHSFRVAYQRRLSRSWMLNTGISNGFILNQNIQESFVRKAYAVGVDAAVMLKLNNGKLLKENPRVAPFLSFGYRTDYIPSLSKIDEQPWLFHNQYGAGFNIKLAERSHVQMQVALDQKLQGDFNTHIQYRVGLTQSLGKYDEVGPKTEPSIDSDKDGIVDARDLCPNIFGLSQNGGCPDTTAIANKIEQDSLSYIVAQQKARIEELELANAKLRTSGVTVDSGEISSLREQELLLRIYNLEQSHKLSIAQWEQKLKESASSKGTQIDTVFKTEIVYKDAPQNEKLLSDLERLTKVNEELKAKLINTNSRTVDTVYSTKIVYKERSVDTEKEQTIDERKQQLAEQLAAERVAKEKADRIAANRKNVQSTKDTTSKVVAKPSIPEDKNYYVITISSPNISTAESWLIKMKKDFATARILPQPNGYYRVGVFAAKDRQLAGEILARVKQLGYNPAWLSVE